MNAARRKIISTAISSLEQIISDLETARDEEQEAFNNMPESLQQGEQGQASEVAGNNLDSAVSNIQSGLDDLQNIE